MVLHISFVVFPIVLITCAVIYGLSEVLVMYYEDRQYWESSEFVQTIRLVIIPIICLVGMWFMADDSNFQFIHPFGVGFIFSVDLIALSTLAYFICEDFIGAIRDRYVFDIEEWRHWATIFVTLILLLIHLFYSCAAIFQWDWAFGIIDNNAMLEYQFAIEDYSINQADREEQDFWNAQFEPHDISGE